MMMMSRLFSWNGKVTWNFVNDSLRTTLCLEYRPQLIAAAALLLAARKHAADHNLPIHLSEVANAKGVMVPWYESLDLGITMPELEGMGARCFHIGCSSARSQIAALRSATCTTGLFSAVNWESHKPTLACRRQGAPLQPRRQSRHRQALCFRRFRQ